ncbi:electron transfer flavoprotein subunit beta/FixA family protein [Arthrobacter sp. STN4]|uniref:electron transfer flavoprotein subunit beta/FixA family protein n=1 Tax=Arthrobacter sp. STN4 TaxID=2923276 RepID=UPI002119F078|nr:electron transfer flavoprotein subunit beta/FixA family protein [Arthrobacter sp. STN4]MCQ9163738.1 electron transfer flavoprotein subunit beta/FixA family protein [Arthrobacter sp. STN4]
MKIAVLAKQVPNTWSNRKLDLVTGHLDRSASEAVPDEINERAVEVALQFKDAHPDTEIVVLGMGPEDAAVALRKLLAMGADSAVLVTDPALPGSDSAQTAKVLHAALERIGADLVLAGNVSTDGNGGVVPAMIAELRGQALIPGADSLTIAATEITGTLHIDGAILTLAADLPAVASVTEKIAEPRFPNFKNIMSAKKKPLESLSLDDLGIQAGPDFATVRSVMVSSQEKPGKQAGPKIKDDGTAASQVIAFLTANRLI